MPSRSKLDIESTFAKLESVIEKLEDQQTSLQTSLGAFEEGIKLTRQAQRSLREAEQKVTLLLEAQDGEPKEGDFVENEIG